MRGALFLVLLILVAVGGIDGAQWPLWRFVKTLRYFDALPKLPFFSASKATAPSSSNILKPGDAIFSDKVSLEVGPLDDIVMGGVSKTETKPGLFDGLFSGYVSTERNGGFAGIRARLFTPPKDLSSCRGYILNVKGDGQRYKMISRDDQDWNGVAWSASFDTKKNEFTTIKIPFDSLKPTRFAKVLPNHQPFNKSTLYGIQLTLSKFEYEGALNPKFTEGRFSLLVKDILLF
jgi:hypothetical protein